MLLIGINLSFNSYSQLTKNNWLIGGNGKFYSYTTNYKSATYISKTKLTEIDISANVGYFILDKLAFGFRPTFSSVKGKVITPSEMTTNVRSIAAGPFGRYYFLEVEKPFNLVADVGLQYGISFLDNKQIGQFSNFSALFGPAIYFNNCIAMEFLMGYTSSLRYNYDSFDEKNKGFQASIGFQIHLEK